MNRARDVRIARWLSGISVLEGAAVAVIALALGLGSGSLSLIGFGLDSAIDATASVVLVWRFSLESSSVHHGERAEMLAERLIGIVLVISATALIIGAAHALLTHGEAESSTAQIVLLGFSIVVLPPLAFAKRRVADRLESNALRKDALLTAAGAALALIALVAGQFGPSFGLWWADAVASIVIAIVLLREGWDILRKWQREQRPTL
ncbi:MAG TPA: cation transporter [Candidatus Limnocylindrales bacterium]